MAFHDPTSLLEEHFLFTLELFLPFLQHLRMIFDARGNIFELLLLRPGSPETSTRVVKEAADDVRHPIRDLVRTDSPD